MNAIYSIVWSAARNAYIVAHEYANSAGRPAAACQRAAAALVLVLGLAGSLAWAADPAPTTLPTGGQIAAGSGSISQSGANMTVQQNTDKLIANWQSFSIGSQASVTFNQPSSSSLALNRVLGQDPSQILGHLNANGQVMLVNPAGVVFGQGSQVNVGGITATTLSISDADFLAGHYHFSDSANAAAVQNLGHILANGGVVALVAPVVQNEGTIETPNGSTALAAGNDVTLDFSGDGLVTVTVSQSKLDNLVENKGAIRADNGLVILTAGAASELLSGTVNNSGVVEAKGLTRQGGHIVLDGRAVTNDGTLDASSDAAAGGDVTVTGHDILLAGNSHIDASGATGGGQVLVGGDWQGSNGVYQATTVTMAQGASIDVSATQNGDGGTAVLWSDIQDPDSVTTVNGEIRARGGAEGGNGGRIETSAANVVIGDAASFDTRAPSGKTGLWLLDPYNYTIDATAATNIVSALNTTNVAIDTASSNSSYGATGSGNGDINVNAAITSASANTLSLTAANTVYVNQAISVGALNLTGGNSTVGIQLGANITTAGAQAYNGSVQLAGNVALSSQSGGVTFSSTVDTLSSAQLLTGSGSWTVPTGITQLDIWAVGGGGGGGGGLTNAVYQTVPPYNVSYYPSGGGGGGAGGITYVSYTVTPGASLSYVAGNGGNAGTGSTSAATAGGAGVSTTVTYASTTIATASGGSGGTAGKGGDSASGGLGGGTGGNGGYGSSTGGTGGGGSSTAPYPGNPGMITDGGGGGGIAGGNGGGGGGSNGSGGLNTGGASSGYYSATPGTPGYLLSQALSKITGAPNLGAGGAQMTNATSFGGGGGGGNSNYNAGSGMYGGGGGGGSGSVTSYSPYTWASNGGSGGQGVVVISYATAASLSINAGSGYVNFTGAVGSKAAPTSLAVTTTGSTTFQSSVKSGGNLTVDTGTFQLDGAMNVGTNAVSITATGAASEGASGSITASTLALHGSGGIFSFANTANSVSTLAADTGQLNFTNAGALTVGTVGTVNGVTATGPVAIATQSGNLTVAQNIATTDTSSAAIVLNAGKSASAGTSSGGDVVLSGSPMFFTGAGGRLTLFTGSLSGSTGVASLIGSGSGHFRYNSDETATNYTAALGFGGYAVYRERPSISIAVSNASMTYGDTLPTALVTVTGAQNGDTATQIVNAQTAIGGATSASGNFVAGSHAVSVSSSAEQLGYLISNSASGTLTVNARPINITVDAGQSKIYGDADPTLTYTLEANSSGRGLVSGDTFSGALARATGETVGSYAVNQGTLANSNYAIGFTGANFAINQRPITLTATPASKFYGDLDPTLAVTVTGGSLASVAQTDTLSDVTGTVTRQSGSNAGTYNILLGTGTKASNYAIIFNAANSAFTINKRTITLTASKTYDGSAGLTGFVTLGNLAGSETLTYSGATSFSKDVAGNATNYVSAITLADGSGLASNYQLPTLNHANAPVTVSQKTLTVTGSKTYDGTADMLSHLTLAGFVGSETVGYSAATAVSAHVATANNYVSAITLTDGLNSGLAGNYQIPGSYNASNNAVAINAATLTPTISNTGVTKIYDGTTNTTLTPTYTFSGLVSGDTAASLTNTGKAYDSKDVATASTITVSGLAISGITGSNSSQASDYVLDATSKTVAATITPKDVSVSSIHIADKVYDGTTNATSVQSTVLSGVIAADSANVNTTGTLSAFSGKDVGTYSISVTGMSLTGSAAGNYNLTSSTATDSSVAITPRTVTLSAAKTYDGTTNLAGYVTLGGFVGSETLSYTGAIASDSHVATAGKHISAITLANGLNGGLAGNYQLPTLNAANTPATINAATLTPTISNTGVTKVYDGNTSTTLTPTYSFTGLVSGDTSATLSNTGKAYDSKDVATASTITVSGLAISGITGSNGSQASDYVLDATSKTVAATITPRTLSVTYTGVNREYDGGTGATVSTTDDRVAGDVMTVNDTASFGDKNVGTGKTVSVSGASLSGTDAGNYVLASTTSSTTANISARTLNLTYAGVNKVYDGTTDATVTVTDDRVSGDVLAVTDTASFGSKIVGTGKTVSVSGTILGGTDAGNYVLASTTGSTTADITPKPLSLSGLTAENKAYDGNTNATISSYGSLSGLIAGDAVTLDTTSAVASFADPNPGIGKTVIVASLQLAGLDIGNYLLGPQTTTADINSTLPPPQVPTGNPPGNDPKSPGNGRGDPFTPPSLFDGGDGAKVPSVVEGAPNTVSTARGTVDVDKLPIESVVVKLSLAQIELANTGGFLLLDRLHSVDPKLVAIAMVSGEGGLPLPSGLRYDAATGRMYAAGSSGWTPFYVVAVDRNGDAKRFKVQLRRVAKE